MARESPTWSRRRIANELAMLGRPVSKDTVAKHMPKAPRRPRPTSPRWGAWVRAHLAGTIAVDFLTVPTATFDVLYVFIVLELERRRILHVNVTAHPSAAWTARQVVEAVGVVARNRIVGSGGGPCVAMVEAADARERDDGAALRFLDGASGRSVAIESEMRPILVVVGGIGANAPEQLSLAEHDQVVE
jgi:hypothetical protein